MNGWKWTAPLVFGLVLVGCASPGLKPAEETNTPVKDARVSTEFRDDGIRLHYTVLGKLERVEVFGVAAAWKGNYDVMAEMDAKVKLTKFIHGETVTSRNKVRVLANSLSKARDVTLNQFDANVALAFDSEELSSTSPGAGSTEDNTSRRTAERLERTLVETVNEITASGRLTGVRKVGDSRSSDGRFYIARYEWSEKAQSAADGIRSRMR